MQQMEQASADEQARIMQLLAPLMTDKQQWESQFTEEERAVGAAFEQKLRDEPASLGAFM